MTVGVLKTTFVSEIEEVEKEPDVCNAVMVKWVKKTSAQSDLTQIKGIIMFQVFEERGIMNRKKGSVDKTVGSEVDV